MGHVFQAECWKKYPSGHHFLCFMAKGKLVKAMDKALERKKGIFGTFFMKIMEIRRKGR